MFRLCERSEAIQWLSRDFKDTGLLRCARNDGHARNDGSVRNAGVGRILAVLLLIVCISGCGFKLRGTLAKPIWLHEVSLAVQNVHKDIPFALKEHFKSLCIPIVLPEDKNAYHLILERDLSQQQLTSVSASTTPRQYELIYTLVYSLLKPSGEAMIASDSVTVRRPFTSNNNRILGSDFEAGLTYREMHQEAALQVVNRIARQTPVDYHAD